VSRIHSDGTIDVKCGSASEASRSQR
jgi:hypothetical protein